MDQRMTPNGVNPVVEEWELGHLDPQIGGLIGPFPPRSTGPSVPYSRRA